MKDTKLDSKMLKFIHWEIPVVSEQSDLPGSFWINFSSTISYHLYLVLCLRRITVRCLLTDIMGQAATVQAVHLSLCSLTTPNNQNWESGFCSVSKETQAHKD